MIYTFIILFWSINNPATVSHEEVEEINISQQLYHEIGNPSLSYEAFDLAYHGWIKLKDSISIKNNIITLIDFSQPSTSKRFYLIDINKREIIYQNYVAHGKNSGMLNAKKFSNIIHSNQSSLGFFKTGETYYGKHGLSLKLDGLENGINDMARKRHIVIHKANYAEETFIKKHGRLGRSFGCPAIPADNYQFVINKIKDGSLLFIYSPMKSYLKKSTVLN